MGDDALVESFGRDGFARVAAIADGASLLEFAALLGGLFARVDTLPAALVHRCATAGAVDSLEILETLRLEPRLQTTAVYQRCRELAGVILGCEPEPFFDHTIRKPAAVGSGTPWHQDIIYDRYEPDRGRVHFWIPTTAVDVNGGCMEFLAGTHRSALVRHEPNALDPTGHSRIAVGLHDGARIAVPVDAGDATVHHQRTLHRTGPNRSGAERTAWILQFARPRTRREQARENLRRVSRLTTRLVKRFG